MKLKKLKLKNIRSYHAQEIEFPHGSLLLAGDIGSGKTTILLAIEYALFGLQLGQRGSSLLRNNADEGQVSLEFETAGNEVIIERHLKRSYKSVTNDYSAIGINGDKVECSITELKTKVLEILGYPPEFIKKNNLLYRYTIYTPQEQMKQVILEEPEARLNILRHIFGVDKYKRIRENLVILLGYIKEESKVLQGCISTLDEEKVSLELSKSLLASVGEKIKEKEIESAKKKEKRKLVEKELAELELKVKERENFEKEVEKTKILESTKQEKIFSLRREYAELEKRISELEGKFNERELAEVLSNLKVKKDDSEKLISRYFEVLAKINSLSNQMKLSIDKREKVFKIDFCPTCLQNVPEAHKHNIKNETENEISGIKKLLESLEKDKFQLSSVMENGKLEVLKLESRKSELEILKTKVLFLESSKKKRLEIEKELETLKNDIILLLKHAESLKEGILSFSKYNNLFKLKQDELRNSFLQEKNSEIEVAELKKESELTNRNILVLEAQVKAKEVAKEKLSFLLELSDWLSNQFVSIINFIERNVLIKLRLEFSKLFDKWFHMLAGDSFEVHLDENFTPVIMQGDIEMDYSFLSGGERTAIALAYRLSLNQTLNSMLTSLKTADLIILDEPTDGFSDAQLDKMRDVFAELKVSQLIIVSHEAKMENFVDNVIRLKKESGVSVFDTASI